MTIDYAHPQLLFHVTASLSICSCEIQKKASSSNVVKEKTTNHQQKWAVEKDTSVCVCADLVYVSNVPLQTMAPRGTGDQVV